MTLFLQRYNFTVVYRERFFLAFSRHPIQILMSRRSLQPIHAGQHACVSRSSCSLGPHLTGPRRPSPIPYASNYAVPHHHALTCTCCSITNSTVGHLLRSSSYNRQCPERQRSLMTTNFTRRWANIVQPHKSTPYPQCLAYETFFFLFMFLSFYY